MFADDICVFCPSERWLQRILDVCQAYAESHGIIFNCNKTVCMMFKAKSAKSTLTPLLSLGGQYVKSVNQYKYRGFYWILSFQMTNTFTDNCDINIVQQTSCELLFPDVQMQLKKYYFVPFVRPCIHLNYVVISGSHACRDCGWHIILVAELYITCLGERVLVATKFNVLFLPLSSPLPGFSSKGGQKPEGGPHLKNTVWDACSNQEAKREMGGTDFKWGGRAPLAPRWQRPCL